MQGVYGPGPRHQHLWRKDSRAQAEGKQSCHQPQQRPPQSSWEAQAPDDPAQRSENKKGAEPAYADIGQSLDSGFSWERGVTFAPGLWGAGGHRRELSANHNGQLQF